MNARLLILVLAVLLGGCATRGALDFDCPRFDTAINGQRPFRTVLRPTELERVIRGERIAPEESAASEEAQRAEENLIRNAAGTGAIEALLLSGGGQWGAFGAGFMTRLLDDGHFPRHLRLVTGVSTGALQALFVGAGLDRDLPLNMNRNWAEREVTPHRPNDRGNYADLMQYEYRPTRENEIVNRNRQELSIATGSMAGLQPLREVIENALCADPTASCMIDDLATSRIEVLIGFVDAEDGNFYYVHVNRIARSTSDRYQSDPALGINPRDRIYPLLTRRQAQQCITAAALASVAMPAFFQQVRVNRRTYYDGGVRRSVFADYAYTVANVASGPASQPALTETNGTSSAADPPISTKPPPPTVYVLRNGPTSVQPDEGANADRRSVIDSALRAEQVVVNELEVGSVAGLRLEQSYGPMLFRSADHWESFLYHDDALGSRTCEQRKGEGIMFDPDFMRCIMAYGRLAGGEHEPRDPLHGWRRLPGLKLDPEAPPKPQMVSSKTGPATR